jgi:hypothetical protein
MDINVRDLHAQANEFLIQYLKYHWEKRGISIPERREIKPIRLAEGHPLKRPELKESIRRCSLGFRLVIKDVFYIAPILRDFAFLEYSSNRPFRVRYSTENPTFIHVFTLKDMYVRTFRLREIGPAHFTEHIE